MPFPNNNSYGNPFSFGGYSPSGFGGSRPFGGQFQTLFYQPQQRPKIPVPVAGGVGAGMGQSVNAAGMPPVNRIPKVAAGYMSVPPEPVAKPLGSFPQNGGTFSASISPLSQQQMRQFQQPGSISIPQSPQMASGMQPGENRPNPGMRPPVNRIGDFGGSHPSAYGVAPPASLPVADSPEVPGIRPLAPDESAQLAAMERQHQNMKLGDQNLPRWQGNAAEINRQAGVMERTQLPENPTGITPQQAFMQIPGNPYSAMQDRFTRISANPSPNVIPANAYSGMTASAPSPSGSMPNYAQRLAQADPNFDVNNPNSEINKPAYYTDWTRPPGQQVVKRQSITPLPRAGEGQGLTPEEASRMNAAGSSIGEWMAKSDWMKGKGYEGAMTPAMSQEYAASRREIRAQQAADMEAVRQRDRQQAADVAKRRADMAQQTFRIRNPGLFADINPNAAQFYATLAGAPFRQFNPYQGGLSPLDQTRATMAYRGQLAEQQAAAREAGDTASFEAIGRQIQGIDAQLQGQFLIDGTAPGMPTNPVPGSRPVVPPQRSSTTPNGSPLTYSGQWGPYWGNTGSAAVYGFGPSF